MTLCPRTISTVNSPKGASPKDAYRATAYQSHRHCRGCRSAAALKARQLLLGAGLGASLYAAPCSSRRRGRCRFGGHRIIQKSDTRNQNAEVIGKGSSGLVVQWRNPDQAEGTSGREEGIEGSRDREIKWRIRIVQNSEIRNQNAELLGKGSRDREIEGSSVSWKRSRDQGIEGSSVRTLSDSVSLWLNHPGSLRVLVSWWWKPKGSSVRPWRPWRLSWL